MKTCFLSNVVLALLVLGTCATRLGVTEDEIEQSPGISKKNPLKLHVKFLRERDPPAFLTPVAIGLVMLPFLFSAIMAGGLRKLYHHPKESLVDIDVQKECYVGEDVFFEARTTLKGKIEWCVQPDLPRGLSFDSEHWAIRGVPLQKMELKSYRIFASTRDEYASCTIQFSVNKRIPVPVEFAYPGASDSFPCDAQVYLVPDLKIQTAVTQRVVPVDARSSSFKFYARRELPPGLTISPSTGIISGAPSAPSSLQTYEIVAQGDSLCDSSSISCELSFSVTSSAPRSLTYPDMSSSVAVGEYIALEPMYEGIVSEWSVTPELPEGLFLDVNTGAITGVPTQHAHSGTFVVEGIWGNKSVSIELNFEVCHGSYSFAYEDAEESYPVNRPMELFASTAGAMCCVEDFTIDPPLPSGLDLDPDYGVISGTPLEASPPTEYTVCARMEHENVKTTLTFAISSTMPPAELCYPHADDEYFIGESVSLEPEFVGGAHTFDIEPALPPGMEFDPSTGRISGAPTAEAEETTYTITATNDAGSTSVEVCFLVMQPANNAAPVEEEEEANKKSARSVRVASDEEAEFAQYVDGISSLEEMPPSPPKGSLKWMIWMVHRAWLDDPTLELLDFSGLRMPPPYVEPRIAPKLMRALEWNTNLQHVLLASSHLQSSSVEILAESLKSNETLRTLNIEHNELNSLALSKVADALAEAEGSALETWCLAPKVDQRSPNLECSLSNMARNHTCITKLGYYCKDPAARHAIDSAITRNADKARRKRKKKTVRQSVFAFGGERLMSRVLLLNPPADVPPFALEADAHITDLAIQYTLDNAEPPSVSQLQRLASAAHVQLNFRDAAPMMLAFHERLLTAAKAGAVTIADLQGTEYEGKLKSWEVKNDRWSVELRCDGHQIIFKSERGIKIQLSDAFVEWLRSCYC